MGKYSDDFVAKVGKRFLEYLCETNQLRTWSKPELNEIYQEFRESKRTTPCFSRMLFIVARKSSLLIVKNGCVIFKGTADWSSANSSNPIRRFVSHEIQSERQKIIIALREAKAKDSFLVSSEVEISADRGDVESSPGYFVCDLDVSGGH
ncbi:unnamed protein product [Clavelina lepadiformis]|uniref:Helicase MOV-10 N-terminal domain-containing protein n=1 Tax=Clavelina lepadiformis TaxID=159417 RepID=A0ABP0G3L6_CLALP